MAETERKNLILLVFVLAGMVLVLLFLNFQGTDNGGQKAEALDPFVNSGPFPSKLSKSEVMSFAVKPNSGKIIFYESLDSMIYETGPDGRNKKEIARLPGVKEIIFSPDGQKAVAAVSERGETKKYVFDLVENKRTVLNPKTLAAAFSPDGSKIAYYLYDIVSGEGGIYIAESDGQGTKVFNTRIKSTSLGWPEKDTITFSGFAIRPDGTGFGPMEQKSSTSANEAAEILGNLGIAASSYQIGLFGELIYINAGDGKLYSLYRTSKQ